MGKGTLTDCIARVDTIVRRIHHEFTGIACTNIPTGKPKHGFVHKIETTGGLICSPCRRLVPAKLTVAKEYFKEMEATGICECSDSPWVSPLHMVVKLDGSCHPSGDFRQLNNMTVPSTYSVPNIKDFSARLAGCTVFSTVDLTKAY